MSIIDHGIWQAYTPDWSAAHDVIKRAPLSARFSRNAKGDDWYVYQKTLPADRQWIVIRPANNQVLVAHTDVSMIFPGNFRLLESTEIRDYATELAMRIYDEAAGTFNEAPPMEMRPP